jgi:hypothetical protein
MLDSLSFSWAYADVITVIILFARCSFLGLSTKEHVITRNTPFLAKQALQKLLSRPCLFAF